MGSRVPDRLRTVNGQAVADHFNQDPNGWDCDGNNVSSGLCSSNVIAYIESQGKRVVIQGAEVSIIDAPTQSS